MSTLPQMAAIVVTTVVAPWVLAVLAIGAVVVLLGWP